MFGFAASFRPFSIHLRFSKIEKYPKFKHGNTEQFLLILILNVKNVSLKYYKSSSYITEHKIETQKFKGLN